MNLGAQRLPSTGTYCWNTWDDKTLQSWGHWMTLICKRPTILWHQLCNRLGMFVPHCMIAAACPRVWPRFREPIGSLGWSCHLQTEWVKGGSEGCAKPCSQALFWKNHEATGWQWGLIPLRTENLFKTKSFCFLDVGPLYWSNIGPVWGNTFRCVYWHIYIHLSLAVLKRTLLSRTILFCVFALYVCKISWDKSSVRRMRRGLLPPGLNTQNK